METSAAVFRSAKLLRCCPKGQDAGEGIGLSPEGAHQPPVVHVIRAHELQGTPGERGDSGAAVEPAKQRFGLFVNMPR